MDKTAPAAKPFWGIFPIGQTPVTPDNKLDLDGLASEVKFCNRAGVAGFAWPQIASGWSTLSEKERMDGAEAIIAAGKGGKTALVIGVQSTDEQIATCDSLCQARRRNRRRRDHRAASSKRRTTRHLSSITRRSARQPIFRWSCRRKGDMSVDLIVEMFRSDTHDEMRER